MISEKGTTLFRQRLFLFCLLKTKKIKKTKNFLDFLLKSFEKYVTVLV